MMWRLHNALTFHTVYHVYCAQVWLNSHFPHWPLTHLYSQTNALSWLAQSLQPPESCTIEKGAPAQGGCTVDLLTARAEEKTTFMSRSGGQYHHTSTPRRADWKLIKNASLPWMTGRFVGRLHWWRRQDGPVSLVLVSPWWPQPLSCCQALSFSAAAYQWSCCVVCAK